MRSCLNTNAPWLGNPLLSALARLMFGAPVRDSYCGMRAFSRKFYERLRERYAITVEDQEEAGAKAADGGSQ